MTQIEIQTLQNLIDRLKKPNCGCASSLCRKALIEQYNENGIEAVDRLYLDTWVISVLKLLLPGEHHDPKLARSLSS